MARNRMIKTEFFKDPKVSELTLLGRLLFVGMWQEADDSGVCRGHSLYLKNQLFPYDEASKSEVEQQLVKMCLLGFVHMVFQNMQPYFIIRNWQKHQKISKASTVRMINEGEEIMLYEFSEKNYSNSEFFRKDLEKFRESCGCRLVKIHYTGKAGNEIEYRTDSVESEENYNFPDPSKNVEYRQKIMDMKLTKCCPICQRQYSNNEDDMGDLNPVIDHKMPRSKGGTHHHSNLQVICSRCNAQKYNFTESLEQASGNFPENSENFREGSESAKRLARTCGKEKEKGKVKENKKEKEKEKESVEQSFSEFWERYPRKENRIDAFSAYCDSLRLGATHELLMRALILSDSLRNEELKFVPFAKTWLLKEPWRDLPVERPAENVAKPEPVPVVDPISKDEMLAEVAKIGIG